MNKYILALASFSIFLFDSNQLMSIQLSRKEQLLLNEQLLHAAELRDTDKISSLLRQGANANCADNRGFTALRFGAMYGNTDMVSELIKYSAQVNEADTIGWTPLTFAIAGGHAPMVKMLIEHGADVNHVASDSRTALIEAILRGQRDIVRMLIEAGANVNHIDKNLDYTALEWTAERGHTEIARMLIEAGADVNYADNNNFTPLVWAATQRNIEMVAMLVRCGAIIPSTLFAFHRDRIIQALRQSGISPLALAIIVRDTDTITRLLARDNSTLFGMLLSYFSNSINDRDAYGMTALHWAVAQNYGALVEDLLAEYHPGLNIQDNEGNTVLHLAARNGNDLILQVLLAHGVRIDVQNAQGNTALHLAAQAGHVAIVRSLIRHDSATVNFVNRVNDRGLSAWLLARGRNYRDIERLLEPMAGQALLNLLSTEGQQGRFGVLHTDNDTNGTAQTLGVLPDGVLPAEIAAHIARFVVAQRPYAHVRSNPNSNS